MQKELLKVSNLSISYNGKEKVAVDDCSFAVKSGSVLAIVGESGSGKTSIIRAVMGILPKGGSVSSGEVIFDGDEVLTNKKSRKGKEIAFVFQNSGAMLNPVITIGKQYVEYIRAHTKMSKQDATSLAIQNLKKVSLKDAERVMATYPFELSGGMQQRVGIAMAITFNPKLILADEPTSALDVTTQLQIIDLLKEINKEFNTSIVIVTHNLGVASYLADDCIVMLDGKIVEQNSMDEIVNNPAHDYTKKLISTTVLKEEP